MIKKIKKIFFFSIFLTLIYIGNIEKVYGGIDVTVDWGGHDGEKDKLDSDGDGIPGGGYYCGEGVHAYCSVSRGAKVWSRVTGDMYDMYGNEIGDIFTLKNIQPFLAGTYVGLDIYEDKGYESWASYSVSAVKITYICSKEVPTSCAQWSKCQKPGGGYRNCAPCQAYNFKTVSKETFEQGCDAGYELSGATVAGATACGGAISDCSARATPPVLDVGGPSYKITYNDSNDIKTTKPSEDKYNTMETIVGQRCTGGDIVENDGKNTRTKNCTYSYNREKTCINIKNGKVRYITKDNKCDESIEYELTYNEKYWKYFIPLNASSKDDFSLLMTANDDTIQEPVICKAIIDKYDNYADLIITRSNENLPKITPDMRPLQIERIKNDAKDLVENGCKYSSTIIIPIVQRFYNEKEDGHFSGFNFYYKPIDTENPFPNTLTGTSIWYDWSKSELDISKSYDEVTYIANTSGNEEKIRDYQNKTTEYEGKTYKNKNTSWYNMYTSGKSSFIEKEGIVTRYVKEDSFYALGCGPWNENQYNEDGSKNNFYQPECGIK